MLKVETLRASVKQRLAAAAEEIFELFERTIAEYGEELRHRRKLTLLDAVFYPEVRLHREDVEKLLVSKDPPELQDWSPSLDQKEPVELPHAPKEEEEEPADNVAADVPLSEEDEFSQLHPAAADEDESGEPDRTDPHSDPQPDDDDGGGGGDEESQQTQSNERRAAFTDPPSSLSRLEGGVEPLLTSNAEMKRKDEGRLAASEETRVTPASSSDHDDGEKSIPVPNERGGAAEEEEEVSDEGSDDEEEAEEGSDAGEEESDDSAEQDEEEEEEEEQEEGDAHGDASEEDEEDEDEDEPEDAGGSSEIQTREDIKKELSNMSFEDVLKLQSKVGTKVYNEVAFGGQKPRGSAAAGKKRLNKNRPMEVSAKKPAPFLRQVVGVRKPTFRDPRFDDLSGEYKPEIFEKTYKFINDIRHREKEIVEKQLKKTKTNNDRKEKLQFLLKRMENQERARLSREQQRERELQFKREQRERANQGTRPFFLKSSEKKKLQLAEKYQELKRSGKLENFLSKKRKRNAGKDRRKLPQQLQSKKAA